MCNAPAEKYECIFTSGATGAQGFEAIMHELTFEALLCMLPQKCCFNPGFLLTLCRMTEGPYYSKGR